MAIEFDTFTLPYNRAIPFGLDPESWVMVEGSVPPQSKGSQLDLVYGQFKGANIALRFKLTFEGSPSSPATASFNSFADGLWGKEKKIATHLRQGQRFKVQIIITSKGYKILENDTFLIEFDHRLSSKKIRFLEMEGDLTLEKVMFNWENSSDRRNPVLPKFSAERPPR